MKARRTHNSTHNSTTKVNRIRLTFATYHPQFLEDMGMKSAKLQSTEWCSRVILRGVSNEGHNLVYEVTTNFDKLIWTYVGRGNIAASIHRRVSAGFEQTLKEHMLVVPDKLMNIGEALKDRQGGKWYYITTDAEGHKFLNEVLNKIQCLDSEQIQVLKEVAHA